MARPFSETHLGSLPLDLQLQIVSLLSQAVHVRAFLLSFRQAKSLLLKGLRRLSLAERSWSGALPLLLQAERLEFLDLSFLARFDTEVFCQLARHDLQGIIFPHTPGLIQNFVAEYRRRRNLSGKQPLFSFQSSGRVLSYDKDERILCYSEDNAGAGDCLQCIRSDLDLHQGEFLYLLQVLDLESVYISSRLHERALSGLAESGLAVEMYCRYHPWPADQELVLRDLAHQWEAVDGYSLNLRAVSGVIYPGAVYVSPEDLQQVQNFSACFLNGDDFYRLAPALLEVPVLHLYGKTRQTFQVLTRAYREYLFKCETIILSPGEDEPDWQILVENLPEELRSLLVFPENDKFMFASSDSELQEFLETEEYSTWPFDRPRKRR